MMKKWSRIIVIFVVVVAVSNSCNIIIVVILLVWTYLLYMAQSSAYFTMNIFVEGQVLRILEFQIIVCDFCKFTLISMYVLIFPRLWQVQELLFTFSLVAFNGWFNSFIFAYPYDSFSFLIQVNYVNQVDFQWFTKFRSELISLIYLKHFFVMLMKSFIMNLFRTADIT